MSREIEEVDGCIKINGSVMLPKALWEHSLEVADEFTHTDTEAEKDRFYVAVVHDVVEDGLCTLEDIKNTGVSQAVVDAVDAITRREDELYFDYIARCKQSAIARDVKLVDLKVNIKRCASDLPDMLSLLERYVKAYRKLQ